MSWGRMLEFNASLVRDPEVFKMMRREGQIGSIMFYWKARKGDPVDR